VSIETKIEGEPAAIRDAGRWLQGRFASEALSAGDAVAAQRRSLASDWQGSAGDAFGGRAGTLAETADSVAGVAREGGAALETVAAALERAKQDMADVRSEAAGAGLTVSGTVIEEPKPVPVPSLVPVDRLDGAGRAAQAQAVHAYSEYQEQVKAYRKAQRDARDAFDDWDRALSQGVSGWDADGAKLAVKLAGLMVTAAGGGVKLKLAPRLARQAEEAMELARAARRHGYDMLGDPKLLRSSQAYEELMRWGRHAQNAADDLLTESRNPTLPKGLKLAGHGLNVLGAGLGIYDDLQNGESAPQAVASNGGGALAGILAGTASGGAIGTAFGPGPGTVGGAIVGTGVGIGTAIGIDEAFEHADEVADNIGDTASDMVEDLTHIGGPLP